MANPLDLVAFAKRAWEQTSQPLVERGIPGEEFNKDRGLSAYFSLPYLADKLAPVGTYEDGRVGLALPKAVTDLPQFSDFVTRIPGAAAGLVGGLVDSTKRLMDSDLARTPINDDAAWQQMGLDAFDAAGLAATGGLGVGLAGGLADNAVGSAGAAGRNAIQSTMERLGLNPKGILSEDIARAALDGGHNYYGVRLTDVPLQKGQKAPNSYHWEDGMPTDTQLPGPSTIGLEMTPEGIAYARSQIHDYMGQNANLIGGPRRITGDDPGEWVMPGGEVLATGTRPVDFDVNMAYPLFSNAPTGSSVPLAVNALERAQPQGIRAYHGSPHDFDRFSLDKIGTGEGAQAYGHGLYFTDSTDVAKNYAPRNSAYENKLQTLYKRAEAAGDYTSMEVYEQAMMHDLPFELASRFNGPEYQSALRQVEKISPPGTHGIYEVNIRANPEDFLDWDKPLSQQSEAVRNSFVQRAMDAAQRGSFPKADTKIIEDLLARDVPASEFYTRNRNVFGRAEDASQALRDAGIPGIRYLDGMSRGAGEGSSNYVVFDDQLIDILRKYSNAPTGAAVPLAQETQDQDPALLEVLRQYGLIQ